VAIPDLDSWRRAGLIGSKARQLGEGLLRPGATRRDVAEEIEGFIRSQGARPAFPVNISVNWEAAHYTPSPEDDRRLQTGDVVKLDLGAQVDGFLSDTAVTVEIGAGRYGPLIRASREALLRAEALLRPGRETGSLAREIEQEIHRHGFKPVRDLTGHTIERYLLHAGKSLPNASGFPSTVLREGEVVALEPFATNGEGHIENGPFGNIVRFRGPPPPEPAELGELYRRFSTLPFCARWIEDEDLRRRLGRLRRHLQSYPVFLETGRGMVSQSEHTLLITADGAELLTP